MTSLRTPALMTAVALIATAPMALAQDRPVTGGTAGSTQGDGVSVSTSSGGATDGTSIGVTGTADATAVDGTARTDASARLNERRAMQRSSAYARTDEEMARSRSRTTVRNGEEVRSRTTTMYRDRDGGPPVRTRECSVSTPEGTVTTDCRGGPD